MQFQADVLGFPVVRPSLVEATAFGAAYLAGVQAGWWKPGAVVEPAREQTRFIPAISDDERAALLAQWRRAVDLSRGWAR
jgi:glycerol kinase